MQKKYFDQIEKGEKIEEYRDDTSFYRSRLLNKAQTAFKRYNTVILQEGYHKGARRMIIEVKQVTLNNYFTIHLGKILDRQNF
ncbi:hypothetical protein AOB46_11320 [Chryseobacterium indologenes]|uniref:ASCH domain-containing protein n=2 Tax=Chryseobacterium indologenes TaxID=253 RepID=A0A0N0ZUQ2_CHRID|nr:hypothetical protein AOB46_11320 [Chryseobacterium indologenes]